MCLPFVFYFRLCTLSCSNTIMADNGGASTLWRKEVRIACQACVALGHRQAKSKCACKDLLDASLTARATEYRKSNKKRRARTIKAIVAAAELAEDSELCEHGEACVTRRRKATALEWSFDVVCVLCAQGWYWDLQGEMPFAVRLILC